MYSSSYYGGYYDRGASGFLAGIGAGTTVIALALMVFSIVCMWRIFEKAGEPGWKCLIPVYNIYVFYKIAWEAKYFLYLFLGIIVCSILIGVGIGGNSGAASGIGGFLMVVLYAAVFVFAVISMVKLSKRFGKSGAFAIGLILLNTIFMAILAFDSSTYDRSRTDPYTGQSSSAKDDPFHSNSNDF